MSIDRQIRRMQLPQPGPAKSSKAGGTATTGKKIALTGPSKESSAQPGGASRTIGHVRPDAGADWKGQQHQHMEQRGHCSYLDLQGNPGQPSPGRVDVYSSSDFYIDLKGSLALYFDFIAADLANGSYRGNVKLSRRFWPVVVVKHNGHQVYWNAPRGSGGIQWPNGELPDMTPISADSEFVFSFMIDRVGRDDASRDEEAERTTIRCVGFLQTAVDPDDTHGRDPATVES